MRCVGESYLFVALVGWMGKIESHRHGVIPMYVSARSILRQYCFSEDGTSVPVVMIHDDSSKRNLQMVREHDHHQYIRYALHKIDDFLVLIYDDGRSHSLRLYESSAPRVMGSKHYRSLVMFHQHEDMIYKIH